MHFIFWVAGGGESSFSKYIHDECWSLFVSVLLNLQPEPTPIESNGKSFIEMTH